MLVVAWLWLPETLPPEQRHPLHPAALLQGYAGVFFAVPKFVSLALANAGMNMGIYVYIFSRRRPS